MTIRRFKNEKYRELANVKHEFKAEVKDDTAVLLIYGDIGESFWEDSTSAKDVEAALKNITSSVITVRLNSPGGDVFDGIAIYNLLKNHPAKIIIYVDGLAGSAASLLLPAADEVYVNTGAMVMIHEASTFAWGTKTDIQKTLNALEGVDKSIVDIYMTRFKGDRSEVETMILNETWMTSDEAVALGFADAEKETNDPVDPEDFKNKVLARFKKQQVPAGQFAASTKGTEGPANILSRFKRSSNE